METTRLSLRTVTDELRQASRKMIAVLSRYEALDNLMRQTGRTTRQIQEAPKDAVYVCMHSQSIPYVKRLAEKMVRTDLEFISLSQLTPSWVFLNLNRDVILDHACLGCLDGSNIEALSILDGRQND